MQFLLQKLQCLDFAFLTGAILFAFSAVAAPLFAQRVGAPPVLATPPAAAQAADGHLDPEAATQAYLATLPRDKKAASDAYYEGGYWLILWDFVISAGVFILLLATGVSSRMRDIAERWTSVAFAASMIYWVQFLIVVTLLTLPWTIYEGFVREHAYSLSNQTFAAWAAEQGKGLLVSLVLGRSSSRCRIRFRAPPAEELVDVGIGRGDRDLVPRHCDLARRARAGVQFAQEAGGCACGRSDSPPCATEWNCGDGCLGDRCIEQSKRISANVSGALGTERITLNDNLLNRASVEEIEAVMGHEMGHYVLNHIYKGVMELGILIVIGFALIAWLFERLRVRYEATWKVRAVTTSPGFHSSRCSSARTSSSSLR